MQREYDDKLAAERDKNRDAEISRKLKEAEDAANAT